jgi:hypothetical protein
MDKPKKRRGQRQPLFGSMKGTFTIAPGVDLTEPAMPEWADLIEQKYGKDHGRGDDAGSERDEK